MPTIEEILWRQLSAEEISAVARAKAAMHWCVELTFAGVAASAIRECDNNGVPARGATFCRSVTINAAARMRAVLRSTLEELERASDQAAEWNGTPRDLDEAFAHDGHESYRECNPFDVGGRRAITRRRADLHALAIAVAGGAYAPPTRAEKPNGVANGV